MTVSQTPFLAELAAGHRGPPIPQAKRAYFQERARIRLFNFLLDKFVEGQAEGLTKAALARRIGKTPDVVNRWLGAPSNLTINTVSDLLLGIASEEIEFNSSSPLGNVEHNYSHFHELNSESELSGYDRENHPRCAAEFARSAANPPPARPVSSALDALTYDPSSNRPRFHLGDR